MTVNGSLTRGLNMANMASGKETLVMMQQAPIAKISHDLDKEWQT